MSAIPRVFAFVLLSLLMSTVIATTPSNNTIEGCAALLPERSEYEIKIKGKISTQHASPEFNGGFSLNTAPPSQDFSPGDDEAAFVECVFKLIKPQLD